jgi:hypothetical protein
MNMDIKIISDVVTAVGTLIMAVIAILTAYRIFQSSIFKQEILRGKDAEERAKYIEKTHKYFSDEDYKGGEIKAPKLEIKKISHNPLTMSPEWKGKKLSVYYYYKDEKTEKLKVKSWRL